MNSKEFKKIYHPRLGRYVYEHRGNGLIVDNLLKPIGRKAKELLYLAYRGSNQSGAEKDNRLLFREQ